MLDVTSIHWALFTAIASDATIVNSNYTVEFSPVSDEDPSKSPRVGVYEPELDFAQGAGGGLIWDVTMNFPVIVTAYNANGRMAAIQDLQRAMPPLLTAIHCNIQLGGAVHIIDAMQGQPLPVAKDEEDSLAAYQLNVRAITQVS